MPNLTGQKIVVIGGNGTLGSAAVTAALGRQANVTILSRRATASQPGAVAVMGSITDVSAVRHAVQDAQGIVISVEASRTPEELERVYVEGTRNVLSVAPDSAQIIFMGHIGITDIKRMPDYNQAKLRAEKLIRESGRPYTIIRPSWVVSGLHGVNLEQGDRYTGRRDDIGSSELGSTIVATFENLAAQGKTFELYGGGERSPDWGKMFAALRADA